MLNLIRNKKMFFIKTIFSIVIFLFIFSTSVFASEKILDGNITIEYQKNDEKLALTIKKMARDSFEELNKKIPLDKNINLDIKLCDKDEFRKFSNDQNDSIQGLAFSSENLIVLKKENIFRNSKEDIVNLVSHEMFHIFLGNSIDKKSGKKLPRWFNEGTALWYSSGINEIFSYNYQNSLQTAFLNDSLINFDYIEDSFPSNQEAMTLAYAQSLSIIDFLVKNYGEEKFWKLIKNMTKYESFYDSFQNTYNIDFYSFQKTWKINNSKSIYTWDYYLSTHINNFIEVLIGLIAFFVFISMHFRNKKKRRKLEEEEN